MLGSCLLPDFSNLALCFLGSLGVCILCDNAKAQISGSDHSYLDGADRLNQRGMDKLTVWIGFTSGVSFTI
jgi:hypothetical protein